MWYIVYREPFESYNIKQGDGYFVKYGDKLSDIYSTNWFEAKRYTSIPLAIKKLWINYDKSLSINDFIKSNTPKDKSAKRSIKLSNILDEKIDVLSILSFKGRIDKVDKDGNFLGNANDEVVSYIENKIHKNQIGMKRKLSKINVEIDKSSYITETKEGEDFWYGF